jgi:hypothetical protein
MEHFRLITPNAFANLSPGLERSDNPGYQYEKTGQTLKGLNPSARIDAEETLSGLAHFICDLIPGLSLRSNPGLKLANAFGVLRVGDHDERLNSIQDTGQGAAQVFGIEGGEAFVEEDQVGAL